MQITCYDINYVQIFSISSIMASFFHCRYYFYMHKINRLPFYLVIFTFFKQIWKISPDKQISFFKENILKENVSNLVQTARKWECRGTVAVFPIFISQHFHCCSNLLWRSSVHENKTRNISVYHIVYLL